MELNFNQTEINQLRRPEQGGISSQGEAVMQLQRLAMLYHSRGLLAEANEIYELMLQLRDGQTSRLQNSNVSGTAE